MTAPTGLDLPVFPDTTDFARALYQEAARHLEDARVLVVAGRHAAAIASAMKAAELGVKAVLVLDGAMGWRSDLFTAHDPFTKIETHPVLIRHKDHISSLSPVLATDIKALELLAPLKPGAGKFDVQKEANPEYPFVSVDSVAGKIITKLDRPATYFKQTDSERHYRTAHQLLAVLSALYPTVASWSVVLPAAI